MSLAQSAASARRSATLPKRPQRSGVAKGRPVALQPLSASASASATTKTHRTRTGTKGGHGATTRRAMKIVSRPTTPPKLRPSEYMAQASLSTLEYLAQVPSAHVPRILELTISDDVTSIRDTTVDVDRPLFQPYPSSVRFQNYEPAQTYAVPVTFHNIDNVGRRVKVLPADSPYFRVVPPANANTKVAPGVDLVYTIEFTPDTRADFECDLVCVTERERFSLPIRALGARPMLDLPDTLSFDNCVVKDSVTRSVLVRNVGTAPAQFTLEMPDGFTAEPQHGEIAENGWIQVAITFTPTSLGTTTGDMAVHFQTGDSVFVKLDGNTDSANVRLDKSTLKFDTTFVGLTATKVLKITNRSSVVANFEWKQVMTLAQQEEAKLGILKELETQDDGELDEFSAMLHQDPTMMQHMAVLERKQQAQRDDVVGDPYLFHHPAFQVEPMSGQIWPNSDQEIRVTFTPEVAGDVAVTMYLDITGREARLPVALKAYAVGPVVEFNADHLDIGAVFLGSHQQYTVSIANMGDIDAPFSMVPATDSEVARCFQFSPAAGVIGVGEVLDVTMSLLTATLGDIDETFLCDVEGSLVPVPLTVQGRAIGPSYECNVTELEFDAIPFGFPSTQHMTISNVSPIPMTCTFAVPKDAPSFREIQVDPPVCTIAPQSAKRIAVTLTPQWCETYDVTLTMGIEGVDDASLAIPITATCVVPDVKLTTSRLSYGRCFMGYVYTQQVEFVNPSAMPAKYKLLPTAEQKGGLVTLTCDPPSAVLAPNTNTQVSLNLVVHQLGAINQRAMFEICGLPDEPLQVDVLCEGQGAVVAPSTTFIDWGTKPVLKDDPRTLILTNESLIPTEFECVLTSEDTVFSIVNGKGILQPGASCEVSVHLSINDTIEFTDAIKIIVPNAETQQVYLRAVGTGPTVVFDEAVRHIDFGPQFASRECSVQLHLTNKGRRLQKLQFVLDSPPPSVDGFCTVMRGATFKKKRTPVCPNPPDPSRSVFGVWPEKVTLQPGDSAQVVLEGFSTETADVNETLHCLGCFDGTVKQVVLHKINVRAQFARPMLDMSSRLLKFCWRQDQGDAAIQTETVTLTNTSHLDITAQLVCPKPFWVEGQHSIVVPAHGSLDVLVCYDPEHTSVKRARVEEGDLAIVYDEDAKDDHVKLQAAVVFPDIEFSHDGVIDCGTVLNGMTGIERLTMTNNTPMKAVYSWQFIRYDSPTTIRSRSQHNMKLQQVSAHEDEEVRDASAESGNSAASGSVSGLVTDTCPTNMFDVFPSSGVLQPGESFDVSVVFYGTPNNVASSTVRCTIQTGAYYDFELRGTASTEEFQLSTTKVDFLSASVNDSVVSERISINNTQTLCLPFKVLGTSSDQVSLEPSSGTVPPNSTQHLAVNLYPNSTPSRVRETIRLQLGRTHPRTITVTGNVQMPCLALEAERPHPTDEIKAHYATACQRTGEMLLSREADVDVHRNMELDRLLVQNKLPLPPYVCDLGSVIRNSACSTTIQLHNPSPFPVSFHVSKKSLARMAEKGMSVSPASVSDLPPGMTCGLELNLSTANTYRAEYSLGAFSADIVFLVDNGPSLTLRASASVCIPELTWSHTEVDFGSVSVGACRDVAVTLTNSSLVPVKWKVIPDTKKISPFLSKAKQTQMLERREMAKVFELAQTEGELAVGASTRFHSRFFPTDATTFETCIKVKVDNNPNIQKLKLVGRGKDTDLAIEQTMLEVGPVLPHSKGTNVDIHITNPTDEPIEIFSVDTDTQYQTEMRVLNLVRDCLDTKERLILPPRAPGNSLPPELLSLLDEQHVSELDPATAAAADAALAVLDSAATSTAGSRPGTSDGTTLKRVQSTRSALHIPPALDELAGHQSDEDDRRSAQESADSATLRAQKAVQRAMARYAGKERFEREERFDLGGLNLIVTGPRYSGKTSFARTVSEHYKVPVVTPHQLVVEAMRRGHGAGPDALAILKKREEEQAALKSHTPSRKGSGEFDPDKRKRGHAATPAVADQHHGETLSTEPIKASPLIDGGATASDAASAAAAPEKDGEQAGSSNNSPTSSRPQSAQLPEPQLLDLEMLTAIFEQELRQHVAGVVVDGLCTPYGVPTAVLGALLAVLSTRDVCIYATLATPLVLCAERKRLEVLEKGDATSCGQGMGTQLLRGPATSSRPATPSKRASNQRAKNTVGGPHRRSTSAHDASPAEAPAPAADPIKPASLDDDEYDALDDDARQAYDAALARYNKWVRAKRKQDALVVQEERAREEKGSKRSRSRQGKRAGQSDKDKEKERVLAEQQELEQERDALAQELAAEFEGDALHRLVVAWDPANKSPNAIYLAKYGVPGANSAASVSTQVPVAAKKRQKQTGKTPAPTSGTPAPQAEADQDDDALSGYGYGHGSSHTASHGNAVTCDNGIVTISVDVCPTTESTQEQGELETTTSSAPSTTVATASTKESTSVVGSSSSANAAAVANSSPIPISLDASSYSGASGSDAAMAASVAPTGDAVSPTSPLQDGVGVAALPEIEPSQVTLARLLKRGVFPAMDSLPLHQLLRREAASEAETLHMVDYSVVRVPEPVYANDFDSFRFIDKQAWHNLVSKQASSSAEEEEEEGKRRKKAPSRSGSARPMSSRRKKPPKKAQETTPVPGSPAGATATATAADGTGAAGESLAASIPYPSLTAHRWIIPANASISIPMQFQATSKGQFDQRITFETVSTAKRYNVYLRGRCYFPTFDSRARSVFGNQTRKTRPDGYVTPLYITNDNCIEFGSVVATKPTDALLAQPPAHHTMSLSLPNTSDVPITVRCSLGSEATTTPTFRVTPSHAEIAPGETLNVTVLAFPKNAADHRDALIICTDKNPLAVIYNLHVVGVKPVLEVDKRSVVFDRVLLRRTDTKVVKLTNPTSIPVAFQVTNLEHLRPEVSVATSSGIVEPNSTLDLNFFLKSDRVLSIAKKHVRIEYCDVDNIQETASELLQVVGEVYDVALDVQFPKSGEPVLDYEVMQVGEEKVLTCILKNKGKYELGYKFSVNQDAIKQHPAALGKDSIRIVPDSGSLSSSDKSTTVKIILQAKSELKLVRSELLLCQVEEPFAKETIAHIPIHVSARVVYSQYRVHPARGTNFGSVLAGTGKHTREVTIENTGLSEFKFSISKQIGTGVTKQLNLRGATRQSSSSRSSVSGRKSTNDPLGMVGGSSHKFSIGCFTVSPGGGTVLPGGAAKVTIEADSSTPLSESHTLVIDVSNRSLAHHPSGFEYNLTMDVCQPAISREPTVLFEEYAVARRNEGVVANELCYVIDDAQFRFGSAVIGRKLTARVKIFNPSKVPAEVQVSCKADYSSTTQGAVSTTSTTKSKVPSSDAIFTIEPSNLTIPSRDHQFVQLHFCPSTIQTFAAVFEAVVDNGDPTSNNVRFNVTGEGILPRVSITKPTTRTPDGLPLLQFPRTLVGGVRKQVLVLRNDGPIAAHVTVALGAQVRRPMTSKGGSGSGSGSGRATTSSMNTRPVSSRGSKSAKKKSKSKQMSEVEMAALHEAHQKQMLSDGCFSCDVEDEVVLAAGTTVEFEVTFRPHAVETIRSALQLVVRDNEFEAAFVELVGDGFVNDLEVSGLDDEDSYALTFGDVVLGATATKELRITNCTDSSIRFLWPESHPALNFSPSLGHLRPRQSLPITVKFGSDEPTQLESHEVVCQLDKITLLDDGADVARQGQRESERDGVANGGGDVSSDASSDVDDVEGEDGGEGAPWCNTATIVRFEMVEEEDGQLKRVEHCEPVPEPTYELVEDAAPSTLTVTCSGVTDHVNVTVDTPACRFGEVLLFSKKTIPVTITNHGSVTAHVEFSLEDDLMLPKARRLPFTLPFESTNIAPHTVRHVNVTFCPTRIETYDASLKLSVDALPPNVTLPVVDVTASSVLPVCHFDLEDSDYVSSGRRNPRLPGPDGIAGRLVPGLRVIEFSSCGLKVRNTVEFTVLNPTETGYKFHWTCLSHPALSTGSTIESGPFKCHTPSGACGPQQKHQVVFEFTPDSLDLIESFWQFEVPEQNHVVPFLLVGHAEEPRVSFDSVRLDLQPVQIGKTVTKTVVLQNQENSAFGFKFDALQLSIVNRGAKLTVSPSSGRVEPNSSISLKVTFAPKLEQPYDITLHCTVTRKPTPLVLILRSEGYAIHSGLEVQPMHSASAPSSHSFETVGDEDGITSGGCALEFGTIHVNETKVRRLHLVNKGKFPYNFKVSLNRVLRDLGVVTATPMEGAVGNGARVPVDVSYCPKSAVDLSGGRILFKIADGVTYPIDTVGTGTLPNLLLSTSHLRFGKVFIYRPGMPVSKQVLTITNKDDAPVALTSAFNGKDSPLDMRFTNCVIAPNESLDIPFTFKPHDSTPFKTRVEFEVNALTHVSVAVSGAGCPLRLHTTKSSSKSLEFGAQQIGATVTKTATLINRSQLPIGFKLAYDTNSAAEHALHLSPATEVVLAPQETVPIKVKFTPRTRIAAFTEEISVQYLNQLEPLCIVSGSCQGVTIELDNSQLAFGAVVVNSQTSRRLIMSNVGDIGARFKWDVTTLGKWFGISPQQGYISPGHELTFTITFTPYALKHDVRCEEIPCHVEGLDEPVLLDLSGVAVGQQPEKEVCSFQAEVRCTDSRNIRITNSSTFNWTLHPVIEGDFFSGPETLVVAPNETRSYAVQYRPLSMTLSKGQKPIDWPGLPSSHLGSIFFPLPDGNALLYNLTGQATPPKPTGSLFHEVPCKVWFTLPLNVENWLPKSQRFRVNVNRLKGDASTNTQGLEYLDVAAMSTKEYMLQFYAYKEGVTNLEVHFKNETTLEYMYYEVQFKSTTASSLETITLSTAVRQSVQHTITLKNPLPQPLLFSMSCTADGSSKPCIDILGPSTFRVPPRTNQAKYTFDYLPLTAKDKMARLVLQCNELGAFQYDLQLKAAEAGPMPTERYFCCLGEQVVRRFKFKNFCPARTDYQITIDGSSHFSAPANLSVSAAAKSGTDASFDIVFEPSTLGESKAQLTVSSAIGGTYTCALFGQCNPPKPSGPHIIKASGSSRATIAFKNVFPTAETFQYTVDHPSFAVKPSDFYKSHETKEVSVRFDGSNGSCMGKLVVTCVSGDGAGVEWVFYLKGIAS
eukprot:m.82988 g.82988  ORF g.82988 m.82988 type:complete len:5086 (+) comp12709_c0_seq1:219-15476(+)